MCPRTSMPRWTRVAAVMAATALVVAGCATLAQPTALDAAWAAKRWPEVTQAELQRGRALYVKRCAGCHALRLPERYPAASWEHHVDEMGKRAHLAPEEREPVLHYLLTMSRPGAAAAEVPDRPR